MSMNFNRPVDDETAELIKKVMGEPIASDSKTFLFDRMPELRQSELKEIANKAKQSAEVEINGDGDIKTMRDGTRYQVTDRGWVKLPR